MAYEQISAHIKTVRFGSFERKRRIWDRNESVVKMQIYARKKKSVKCNATLFLFCFPGTFYLFLSLFLSLSLEIRVCVCVDVANQHGWLVVCFPSRYANALFGFWDEQTEKVDSETAQNEQANEQGVEKKEQHRMRKRKEQTLVTV